MTFLPNWAWQNWNKWHCIDFHGSPSSEKDKMVLLFTYQLLSCLLAGKWNIYFLSPHAKYAASAIMLAPVWTRIVTALLSLTMAIYVKNAELSGLGLNVLEIWRGEWSLAVHQRALRHSEADSSCSLGLIQRGFSTHRIKLFTVWFPSCRSWEVSVLCRPQKAINGSRVCMSFCGDDSRPHCCSKCAMLVDLRGIIPSEF